ncbi:MAG: hypothetical protein ACOYXB_03905 [Bacteroidota bacterium]
MQVDCILSEIPCEKKEVIIALDHCREGIRQTTGKQKRLTLFSGIEIEST